MSRKTTEKKRRSAAVLLEEKRQGLAEAERTLANATASYDEEAGITAGNRVRVLQGFIERLVAENKAELEADATECAADWLDRYEVDMKDAAQRVRTSQGKVQEAVDQLVAAMLEDGELRSSLERQTVAAEILGLRFGLPNDVRLVLAPQDWASSVLQALNSAMPHRPRRPLPHYNASDSSEQRRRKEVLAAVTYAQRYGGLLPEEVRAILESAPAEAEATRKQREDGAPADQQREGK